MIYSNPEYTNKLNILYIIFVIKLCAGLLQHCETNGSSVA